MARIENDGTRRIILGVPAKSKERPLVFGTSADNEVPAAHRVGTSHEVTKERAKEISDMPTVQAMSKSLGLRIS